jgi:hypothetical protein
MADAIDRKKSHIGLPYQAVQIRISLLDAPVMDQKIDTTVASQGSEPFEQITPAADIQNQSISGVRRIVDLRFRLVVCEKPRFKRIDFLLQSIILSDGRCGAVQHPSIWIALPPVGTQGRRATDTWVTLARIGHVPLFGRVTRQSKNVGPERPNDEEVARLSHASAAITAVSGVTLPADPARRSICSYCFSRWPV